MTEHEDTTRDMEREVDEMTERSGRLEDEIDQTREDWERKRGDSQVPGAPPSEADADGPPPEAEEPSGGSD